MKREFVFIRMILTTVLFICVLSEVLCVPQYYSARRPRPNRRNRCPASPYETFFNGSCVTTGSSEHCPYNMQLFDGSDNEGFCDCVENPPAFYSHETGECSFHNTQGPCLDGEWFVLKNGFPQCERVPDGCPADGQHFYGSPYHWIFSIFPRMAKQCWEIGSQGPCPPNKILQVEKDAGELKMSCKDIDILELEVLPENYPQPASSGPSSVGYQAPCRPGTRRNRQGNCIRSGFFG